MRYFFTIIALLAFQRSILAQPHRVDESLATVRDTIIRNDLLSLKSSYYPEASLDDPINKGRGPKIFSSYWWKKPVYTPSYDSSSHISAFLDEGRVTLKFVVKNQDMRALDTAYRNASAGWPRPKRGYWGMEYKGSNWNVQVIDSVQVHIDSHLVQIPRSEFNDLFDPSFYKLAIYSSRDGRRVYVMMLGGYLRPWNYRAIWCIRDGKYLQRVVDEEVD